jgi:hypothetical protein
MNQRERMRRRAAFIQAEPSAAKPLTDAPARIDVRIDELRMHGVEMADRFRCAGAVQNELVRLLSEQGWPAALRSTSISDPLAGGTFSLERVARAEVIGKQIAHAVYRGFSGMEAPRTGSAPAKPGK